MPETNRDLYNSVKWQNEMIDVENAKIRDKYSTDNERVKHMTQNIMGWNVFNFYLWWIFYIIIGAVIYLVIQNRLDISEKNKYYIIGGLLVYPFLISTVELIAFNLYQIIISLIKGIPYPKYSTTAQTGTVFDSLPAFYY
jgi:hypothetical protein